VGLTKCRRWVRRTLRRMCRGQSAHSDGRGGYGARRGGGGPGDGGVSGLHAAPTGKTLENSPELMEKLKQTVSDTSGSPILARAAVAAAVVLFPYSEGLSFEDAILVRKERRAFPQCWRIHGFEL